MGQLGIAKNGVKKVIKCRIKSIISRVRSVNLHVALLYINGIWHVVE